MHSTNFIYNGYTLHYRTIGTGSKYVFAFHGYGLTGDIFKAFEGAMGQRYTIISFDLFHHGGSTYPPTIPPHQTITPQAFAEMLNELCARLGIAKFGLMGYSMGGRMSLCLTEYFKDRVTELFLFAPDGIKPTPGYFFMVFNPVGKMLFKLLIKGYKYLGPVFWVYRTFRILPKKTYNFYRSQVDTEAKRQQLYNAWNAHKLFKPNLANVKQVIRENHIKLHLFTGAYDMLLQPHYFTHFAHSIGPGYKNNILKIGHNLITPDVNKLLAEYLAKENG